MLLSIRQMEATTGQAAASKVSLLMLGHQAIMDAHLCLLHLTTGALRPSPPIASHAQQPGTLHSDVILSARTGPQSSRCIQPSGGFFQIMSNMCTVCAAAQAL